MESGEGPGIIVLVIWVGLVILMVASWWKIFTKAGQPGWASIVPIYNLVVILKLIGRPVWWILLLFIPLVNVVIAIIMVVDLAKSFGKGVGFCLGLFFLGIIFYPILAFSDATYQGPAAAA